MLNFTASLQVILTSGNVPHKVTPVHPVELVREEEFDVFPLCRHVYHDHLPAFIVGDIRSFDVLPGMILVGVRTAVHTWEKHVLRVFILNASGYLNICLLYTSNVEKLADEGVMFTDAHSVAATSTPSRYSFLTGHYAWRRSDTGVAPGDAGMIIRPEQYTVADLFKEAGYATAAVGKWHLGIGDKIGEQNWNKLIEPDVYKRQVVGLSVMPHPHKRDSSINCMRD